MKTEKVRVADLKYPEKNVRVHTKKQIEEIKRSLNMFGQIRPIVVDEDNVILAGNGLVQAFVEMGTDEADVLRVKGLTEKQKKKLMIADNKIFSLGLDDNEAIYDILKELDGDFDVPGFEEDLLQDMLADFDEVDDTISEYGKLDNEQVKDFEEAAERKEERIAQAETQIEEEYDTGSTAETATFSPQDDSEQEAEVRRQVKCPHCGGEIWLS